MRPFYRARQAACDALAADVRRAQAQIRVTLAGLERTTLSAPFAGIVAEVTGEIGEVVAVELGVLLAEVGRAVAPVPAYATLALGADPIARHGNPEQQQRFLPGVV
ncbi:MAG TPA: acyl-CoA dehydrogenase family protein, partial [Anaerolineales bacterium]